MLKQEQILIEDSPFINDKSSYIDIDKAKRILCEIANQIIDALNIQSLASIKIREPNLFENKLGRTNSQIVDGKMISHIELAYEVFVNVYIDIEHSNFENHIKSVSTIWHEFYHVYDNENLFQYTMIPSDINRTELSYYICGKKYWSEFFVNYKTFEYYETEYKYDMLADSYNLFKEVSSHNNMHEAIPEYQKYIYCLSTVLGYACNSNHNVLCDDTLGQIKEQNFVDSVKNQLLYILNHYPTDLTYSDLVKLGEIFYNALPFDESSINDFLDFQKKISQISLYQ